MDFDSLARRARRGALMRLFVKLSLLLTIASAMFGWLAFPQAAVWQRAGESMSEAGGYFRTATIRVLGGSPSVEVSVPTVKSVELDKLRSLNGFPASEFRCLAVAVYFEAGRESREAQLAVGQIALNRAKERKAPRELCRVVYHGLNIPNGCLFAATCRNLGTAAASGPALESAVEVARALLTGASVLGRLAGATHFHERSNRPAWSRTLFKLETIGRLEFYSTEQPDGVVVTPSVNINDTTSAQKQTATRRQPSRQEAGNSTGSSGLGRQVFGAD